MCLNNEKYLLVDILLSRQKIIIMSTQMKDNLWMTLSVEKKKKEKINVACLMTSNQLIEYSFLRAEVSSIVKDEKRNYS